MKRTLLSAFALLSALDAHAVVVHQVDPVMVTVSKIEKSMLEVPASTSVINAQKLERYNPQNLADTFKDVPNVSIEGGPRFSAAQLNVRGFGPGRVVLKTDGVRQNFESGHRGQIFMDPDLLKQVEVVRGPQSTLHGSGSLGGVIGFFTKDASDFLKEGEKWGGLAKTNYASNGHDNSQSTALFGRYNERADGLVYLTKHTRGNIRPAGGPKIDFSKENIVDGLAKANLYLGDSHTLKAEVQHFYDDHKLPAQPQLDIAQSFRGPNRLVHGYTNQSLYKAGYNYDNDNQKWFKIRSNVYLNQTHIFEKGIDPTSTRNPRDHTKLDTFGFDVTNTTSYDLCSFLNTTATYGVEFYRDEQSGKTNGAERGSYPKAHDTVLSFFGEKDINITKYVTLTPGLRFDSFNLKGKTAGLSLNHDRLLPKGVITLKPFEQIHVYGLYAEGYRVPTLSELFNRDLHIPRHPKIINGMFAGFYPNNFFVPNPDLKPESNQTFEIGINAGFDDILKDGDRLTFKTSGFITNGYDFIDISINKDAGTTTRVNVAKTRIKGFEAEATYHIENAYMGISGALLRGRDVKARDHLASIPGDKIATHFGYVFQEVPIDLGVRSTYVTTQNRLAKKLPESTRVPLKRTPGFGVHDLYGVYSPADLKCLKIVMGIDNVFNKNYRYHLSALPEMGRNYKIGGSIRF